MLRQFGTQIWEVTVTNFLEKHGALWDHYQRSRQAVGVPITTHDKLPDIILFHEAKNWLYLIEVVASHGPVSHKRRHELELLLKGCTAKRVYISAFLDFIEFRRSSTYCLGN